MTTAESEKEKTLNPDSTNLGELHYALHRRHRDTYRPEEHGPRSGASGVLTMMEHIGTHIEMLDSLLEDSGTGSCPPTSLPRYGTTPLPAV